MNSPVKIWRNQKYMADLIGQKGRVLTYTLIRVPQEGFSNQAPYPVAIVELENGVRITVQVIDCDGAIIKKGQQIELIIRRVTEPDPDGVIPYGVKGKLI